MDNMIGIRIKERRKALKLTGAQIKEKTGISTGNLSDIENGRSLPSATAVILLSQILDCSTDYILLGETQKSEENNTSDFREYNKDEDVQLLSQFHALTEEDQEEILMMVQIKYNRTKKTREREPKSSLFESEKVADETA